MRRLGWIWAVWLAIGCGSSVDDGGSSADDACPASGECRACSDLSGQNCTTSFTCELASVCGRVEFSRDSTQTLILDTPNEATCVLEALRDGVEAEHHWAINPGGQFTNSGTLDVLANRVGLLSQFSAQDLAVSRSRNGPGPLQAADFFSQCLTQTDPQTILDCIQNATTSCGL